MLAVTDVEDRHRMETASGGPYWLFLSPSTEIYGKSVLDTGEGERAGAETGSHTLSPLVANRVVSHNFYQ
jgi:hypothetical protein